MERPIKINIRQVIDERLPRYRRFIPRWAVAWLERTVHQDDLNALLASNAGKCGPDFASGVLADLDVTYTAHGLDAVRDHRRPLIVCNHPLGGLDGLMMIDLVARTWGRNLHFVVNDLLMAVEPLRDVFLPVNKHGRQSRDDMAAARGGLCRRRPGHHVSRRTGVAQAVKGRDCRLEMEQNVCREGYRKPSRRNTGVFQWTQFEFFL